MGDLVALYCEQGSLCSVRSKGSFAKQALAAKKPNRAATAFAQGEKRLNDDFMWFTLRMAGIVLSLLWRAGCV